MSDNNIEITEISEYKISIDTSLIQNENNIEITISGPNNVDIINNNNIILLSDLPYGYPINWTVGDLPISRVSGLAIVGGSGINVLDNSGIYTISVTGNFGLTGEEVDDRINNLLIPGNYIDLNYNDSLNTLTIGITGLQPTGNYSLVGHGHIIDDINGLQIALDGKQPSGIYASGTHYHTSADITDFNNSVSGLLQVKNIITNSGINSLVSSGIYTLSLGSHASSHLPSGTDQLFNQSLNTNNDVIFHGLYLDSDLEVAGDVRIANIYDGELWYSYGNPQTLTGLPIGISGQVLSVNSLGTHPEWKTLGTAAYSNSGDFASTIHSHLSSDITNFDTSVSGLLQVKNISAGSGISVINTGGDFSISVTGQFGLTSEQVDDRINSLLIPGNYISLNYNDNLDSLTIDVTGLQPSGNYSLIGHSHNSSDIIDFSSAVSGLIPPSNFTSLSGVSGIIVTNNGTNYFVGLTDPTVQLIDITDLSSSARTFLLTTSSSNLLSLMIDKVGSGLLVFNNSPAFSGIPTAPTASSGTNSTQIASTAFVRNEISNLIDSAPSTLDTLNELAAALGDDENFATTITNTLSGKANLTGAIFTGSVSIPSGTGNFNSLTVNGTNVSVSGHTHISSDITNFNNSVSGLLPSVSGSGYIISSFNNNTYTISASGLQPSGNYANAVHSHVVSDISNFNSGVSDALTTTLLSGNYIDLIYDSVLDTLTIEATGLQPSGNYSLVGHTHTSADITNFNSAVSGLLPVINISAGSGIGVSSSSGNFTISVTGNFGLTSEEVDDRVSNLLIPGSYISLNYNDNLNTLTINTSGLQPSGNYSLVGHSHEISDVNGLQIALDSKQPSGIYASGIHYHISSDITDFSSSVSGLLPSITGTGFVNSNFNNNTYTISVTGLQPSGNYSIVGHSHISTDITDFNNAVSGLIPVKNILSGTGINVSNASGVYTIEATGSGVLSDQAKSLVTTVFNKTGSPIPKMTAVYIDGGQGDLPTISLAIATTDMTSAGTYGLTYEAIANMQSGKVIVFGALTGLDTDQFNPTAPHGDINGSIVYLSPSVSGTLTLTKPSAPDHIVAIGTIVRTHQNEGIIEVRVQNGFELDELHNVAISGATNGQFLQYNSGTQLWVPTSSGNFNILQVNGTGVSLNGHIHTASNITDFNSSVSGLLPSNIITGVGTSGYLTRWTGSNVVSSGSIYQSGNNIGIGTISPGKPLEISYNHPSDAAQTGGLRLTNPTASSGSFLEFGVGGNTGYDRWGICSMNNTPVFRITPGGTTSFASNFGCASNVRFVNENNGNAFILLNNGAGIYRQSCVTSMEFQVASVTRATLNSSGFETNTLRLGSASTSGVIVGLSTSGTVPALVFDTVGNNHGNGQILYDFRENGSSLISIDGIGNLTASAGNIVGNATNPSSDNGSFVGHGMRRRTTVAGMEFAWGESITSVSEPGIDLFPIGGTHIPSGILFRLSKNSTKTDVAMLVDGSGNVGIGTANPSGKLNVVGDVNVSGTFTMFSDVFTLSNNKTISASGNAGSKGNICWDSNYLYICVSDNNWKRISYDAW